MTTNLLVIFRPPLQYLVRPTNSILRLYHIMPGIIGSVITAKEDEIEVNLSSYSVRTKYCNHIWS